MPRAVREQFRAYGRAGGRARAARMDAASRQSVARRAAIRRWTRERFGAPGFKELGLPGGDIIDAGLAALAAGEISVESLAVSEAAPRLRREGVPVPRNVFPDAAERLYRLIEKDAGDLAHARYLAWLRRIASFADACAAARVDRGPNA